MKQTGATSTSTEDYLERIQELIEAKGYARSVDIAEALGIRQPSVTAMVQKLGKDGYLNYERYRGLTLTAKGRKVAAEIRERHETLTRFFTLLKVSPETQERDIEGIEHCLSPETLAALAALADYFEATPAAARELAKFARKAAAARPQ